MVARLLRNKGRRTQSELVPICSLNMQKAMGANVTLYKEVIERTQNCMKGWSKRTEDALNFKEVENVKV